MGNDGDADLTQLGYGAVMGRVADFFAAGGGGIYFELGFQAALSYKVGEDALGHGAAADVAVAAKKYFNHVLISSYFSLNPHKYRLSHIYADSSFLYIFL